MNMTMCKTSPEPTWLRIGAEWPRFSAYELLDGCIRPTENARLERYDPLTERGKGGRRPYEDLAELIRQGRYTVSSRAITPETAESVVSWCQQYGLLGVLLQRVETVVLPVQATRSRSKKERSVSQTSYHRTRKGWQEAAPTGLIETTSLPDPSKAGVMLHGLDDSHIVWEPLSQTWGTFFPSVPAKQRHNFPYPHPHDAAFWRMYAEPLDVFLDAAAAVSWLLATIAGGPDTIGQNRVSSDPRVDYAWAISTLNGCARAQLDFQPTKMTKISQHFIAPTLFASLALTALQDLAGQKFHACKKCGRLYVSRAYQTRYCSTRCRATINKRTYRKKHPAGGAAG